MTDTARPRPAWGRSRYCVLPLLAALAMPAVAADRALLVGVGNYQLAKELHLSGIDLDLATMRTVAANLGFDAAQTRVLLDADATLSAVKEGLTDWLRTGVTADDRVLIYFSTHGDQFTDVSGDEDDGFDEALILYDLAAVTGPGGTHALTGILLDDDLGRALAAIPSRQVLVIVDACHSGTMTRTVDFSSGQSGSRQGQVKFFAHPGMPSAAVTRTLSRPASGGSPNYVVISAAADDEQSRATPRGSLFTLGLAQAIGQAAGTGSRLTPRQAKDAAAAYIKAQLGEVDSQKVFQPQIDGDPRLADTPLRLVPVTAGHGPVWELIRTLVGRFAPLPIQADRQSFREGEKLQLTIDVPRDGYLNVISIDARDTPFVLYPNRFHPDNRVHAGRLALPGDLRFDLTATPPDGPALLVAFFTDAPVDLFASGDGQRAATGAMLDVFPQLSQIGIRGIQVTAKTADLGAAGALEVSVCPPTGCP